MINEDWLDEILNGKPSGITDSQWFTIECNINKTSLPESMKNDILDRLNDMSELEAEEIITLLYNNIYETDTQKQWLKMFKDGVFGDRDI